MIAKLIEKITGKDDLERVAYKEDLGLLNAYLKKRPVLVPQRPRRFLDAATFTQEQLTEQIKKDSEQLASDQFEPWILEMDGKKRSRAIIWLDVVIIAELLLLGLMFLVRVLH